MQASGTPTTGPDLLTILVNIGQIIPAFIGMLQWVVLFMGLYLFVAGLIQLFAAEDGASRYIATAVRPTVSGALAHIVFGVFLMTMGDLELVGILSRSLTGNYANSRMLSYGTAGTTLADRAAQAQQALLGILQIVGFIAMTKGILTFNQHYSQGQSKASLGTATTWLLGGILAWNFLWFGTAVNELVGYAVIPLYGSP